MASRAKDELGVLYDRVLRAASTTEIFHEVEGCSTVQELWSSLTLIDGVGLQRLATR